MTLVERTRAAATTAPAVGRSRRTLADELRLALADDIVRGLLVPGAARPLPPRRLLVAVAVGEPGKEDVAFTGRLGRHFGARATVLTVLPETTAAAERAAAERFLAACVRTLERYGVPAVSEIGIGDLGESVRTRLSSGDDLLVVGTPLPDESGDVRFGRAGRDLLEAAAGVPVLVVRASVRGGRSTV